MTRVEFLREFRGALGATEVVLSEILSDRISGTVIYDPEDSEERQDFCWHATEEDVPSREVYRLAQLIHEQQVLDNDRVSISRDELRGRYNKRYQTEISPEECGEFLGALMRIRVRMVDDGQETDSYFIHE